MFGVLICPSATTVKLNFSKFDKSTTVKISKLHNYTHWGRGGGVQDKFENVWLRFVEGVTFLKCVTLIGNYININETEKNH